MWRTTLAGLRERKLRLITSSLAVLIGVAFMAGTLVLTDTMGRAFDQLSVDSYEGIDAVVRAPSSFDEDPQVGVTARSRLDESLVDDLATLDGITVAEGEVEGYTQIMGADGKAVGDTGTGIPTLGVTWLVDDAINPLVLAEGRAPSGIDETVIDKASADAGSLTVGDRTMLLTPSGPTEVTVVGIARWGEVDSPAGATLAAFDLATAQTLLGEPGRLDRILLVGDGAAEAQVRDLVVDALPPGTEVRTGTEMVTEQQDDIRAALGFFNTFMLMFAVVALFVGAFIIYNTFSILVAQRTQEMSLLRAIGATRRQVLGSLLLEAAVIGLIASVLGMVGGIGVAALLDALLEATGFSVPADGVVVTGSTIATVFIVGVGVTVASAVLPARRATRVPPLAAMRDVAIEPTGSSPVRLASGVAVTLGGIGLLAAGLFGDSGNTVGLVGGGIAVTFIGVTVLGPLLARPVARLVGAPLPRLRGMAGALARENAMRNPKRTATTAAALMIGVGLVGTIAIFAESAKASLDEILGESLQGDFVIDSGTMWGGGFTPELNQQIRALDEVQASMAMRVAPAQVDGSVTFLVGVEPDAVEQILDLGIVAGDVDALGATSLAVYEDTAESKGWALGDTVSVVFAETGEQTFEMDVLFTNRDLVGGDYGVTTAAFDDNVPNSVDMAIFVATADGVSADEARAALEDAVAAYPLASVQDQQEFADAQMASFDSLLALVYALLALAVLIALLGIANTLALSILERTRELGLLRAVGMTRGQLRSTVRWEAVIIAVFGSLLGLVVGLGFGWAMVAALADDGFTRFVVPVGQLAAITVLGGLAGVLAAVGPARRAARLQVLDAIAS